MRRFVSALAAVALLLGAAAPALAQEGSIGIVDTATGEWYLRDPANGATTRFFYGNPGDLPFVGDWDGDGDETPGLYRQSDGFVYLRNSNSQGVADIRFFFGNPGDIPLAGDFDGDGDDTVSIYRPSEGRVFIINALGANDGGLGAADFSYFFGNPGDKPYVGDFDDDGIDEVGLHRESTGLVYFRFTHTQGVADSQFIFGDPGDKMVAAEWANRGAPGPETVGLFRPSNCTSYLRYTNTQGVADETLTYGLRTGLPVAGNFGALLGGGTPPPGCPPIPAVSVMSRGDWGARPPELERMVPHTITRLTVHHAGDQVGVTGPSQFRGWQNWHMSGQGWPDIAYHLLIGIDGTIYEGRDSAFRGDTATSYDTTGHFLVVVEGNFEVERPTAAQFESLGKVLAWASEHYDVSPATIAGHGDYAATSCPGLYLEGRIASGELRAAVESLIEKGGVDLIWPPSG